MAMTMGEIKHRWRGLPVGSVEDVAGPGPCLVLAPHPDDESLGCGGLIASGCAMGRPPVVLILTDGAASHPGSRLFPPDKLAALREQEAARAVGILGLPSGRLQFLREPDGAAPHAGPAFHAVVRRVADCAKAFACSSILAPWRFDPHCDHAAAALIAAAAARLVGIRFAAYPVWGWTLPDVQPVALTAVDGWRLDVAPHLDRKRRAIAAHASQQGALIDDAPSGFCLPPALLGAATSNWETYVLP
jgi:LmbE family N-acetylglucosaminyl deacetylase